jgi:DNA-binding Lrp family transcriptional regulator
VSLNLKDRKILFELDKNSRASFVEIAKKTALPQEVVRYRLNSLKKKGVIKKFFSAVNVYALGYSIQKVALRFHNLSPEKKQEIIKYLVSSEKVTWVIETDGNHELLFTINAFAPIELYTFLNHFMERFSKFVARKKLSVNIWGEWQTRDYLIGQKREFTEKTSYVALTKKPKLDLIDKRILYYLADNSRMTSVELAKKNWAFS